MTSELAVTSLSDGAALLLSESMNSSASVSVALVSSSSSATTSFDFGSFCEAAAFFGDIVR